MKIRYGQKWFKPMEIARQGLIQNSKGSNGTVNGHYNFIIDLIKAGELKAKSYSRKGGKPYYLVPEAEIIRYHEWKNEGA